LTRLPHLKCIRLGSVRSSHLPFKMHSDGYVRSSLPILMHVGSIATPYFETLEVLFQKTELSSSKRRFKTSILHDKGSKSEKLSVLDKLCVTCV